MDVSGSLFKRIRHAFTQVKPATQPFSSLSPRAFPADLSGDWVQSLDFPILTVYVWQQQLLTSSLLGIGAGVYVDATNSWADFPNSMNDLSSHPILQFSNYNGTLLAATDVGVYDLSGDNWYSFPAISDISSSVIGLLYQDPSGRLIAGGGFFGTVLTIDPMIPFSPNTALLGLQTYSTGSNQWVPYTGYNDISNEYFISLTTFQNQLVGSSLVFDNSIIPTVVNFRRLEGNNWISIDTLYEYFETDDITVLATFVFQNKLFVSHQYILGGGGGIAILDPSFNLVTPFPTFDVSGSPLAYTYADISGILYAATDQGVFQYVPTANQFTLFPNTGTYYYDPSGYFIPSGLTEYDGSLVVSEFFNGIWYYNTIAPPPPPPPTVCAQPPLVVPSGTERTDIQGGTSILLGRQANPGQRIADYAALMALRKAQSTRRCFC